MADRRSMKSMRAWSVDRPGPIAGRPLVLAEREIPVPGGGELLLKVRACGVCRTDLHVTEGDKINGAAVLVP